MKSSQILTQGRFIWGRWQAILVMVLLQLVQYSEAITFYVMEEPFCMRFEGGGRRTILFVSSGNQNQNVALEVSQLKSIVFKEEGISDLERTESYSADPIEICFRSTDNQKKRISFDFFNEEDPVKAVIEHKDILLAEKALVETFSTLAKVSANLVFHIERDESHKKSLQASEEKIKWTGLIKIGFLIASALAQVYLMKSFFTSRSKEYQPVQMG